jgi:hypothetical protein
VELRQRAMAAKAIGRMGKRASVPRRLPRVTWPEWLMDGCGSREGSGGELRMDDEGTESAGMPYPHFDAGVAVSRRRARVATEIR